MSIWKKVVFGSLAVVISLFFLEAFTSWALMLRMRITRAEQFTKNEPSLLSIINIPYKAGIRLGLLPQRSLAQPPFEYRKESSPKLSVIADPDLGFRVPPGTFIGTYLRRRKGESQWERFRVKYTWNADGTRWTGDCDPGRSRIAYIFDGSFAAGSGVNDEQTFSFLLQLARKDLCVKLYAGPGYGPTQSFIQFKKLQSQIRPSDLVVIGYGDDFDTRTVAAPSHLRQIDYWFKKWEGHQPDNRMLAKASLDKQGIVHISFVPQRCDGNGGYCSQPDLSKSEMSLITATLFNQIAETSRAPVYLLHFSGIKESPTIKLLNSSVAVISALTEDFDYFIKDDIEGFDSHPGPYWHYAISRKLIQELK
jgi:hypothetical protein